MCGSVSARLRCQTCLHPTEVFTSIRGSVVATDPGKQHWRRSRYRRSRCPELKIFPKIRHRWKAELDERKTTTKKSAFAVLINWKNPNIYRNETDHSSLSVLVNLLDAINTFCSNTRDKAAIAVFQGRKIHLFSSKILHLPRRKNAESPAAPSSVAAAAG